jgi:hypothetical protein
VALEEEFVHGHVLNADDPFPRLELNDSIHKEEGVAVREKLLNLHGIEYGLHSRCLTDRHVTRARL